MDGIYASLLCNDPLFLFLFGASSDPFILKKCFFDLFPLILTTHDNTAFYCYSHFGVQLSYDRQILTVESSC